GLGSCVMGLVPGPLAAQASARCRTNIGREARVGFRFPLHATGCVPLASLRDASEWAVLAPLTRPADTFPRKGRQGIGRSCRSVCTVKENNKRGPGDASATPVTGSPGSSEGGALWRIRAEPVSARRSSQRLEERRKAMRNMRMVLAAALLF